MATETKEPQTLEEAQAELDALQHEPPPQEEPQYYRVLMPNASFEGKRYRFEFHHGECIIPANATIAFDAANSAHAVETPARTIFADHLHYRVEPIPFGEPPLPQRGPSLDA